MTAPLPLPATTRALRRDRLLARAPRALATTLAVVLILTGLRSLIAPRRPLAPPPAAPATDLAAEGFAADVATAYLTYDARRPERHADTLRALAGDALGAGLGLEPPAQASQHVAWSRVVQDQPAIAGGRLITVEAATDRHGVLDLSIPVRRDRDGRLRVAGYPALIGPPATVPATPVSRRGVGDDGLRRVAARAVTNYLARDAEDLEADLAPGARVALPAVALTTTATAADEVAVAGPGGVLVTVRAVDADGARYALTYELGVAHTDRWYVTAVQAFPTQP